VAGGGGAKVAAYPGGDDEDEEGGDEPGDHVEHDPGGALAHMWEHREFSYMAVVGRDSFDADDVVAALEASLLALSAGTAVAFHADTVASRNSADTGRAFWMAPAMELA
jgi:hypothetical protein